MELVHKNLVLPNNGKKLLLHTCCAPCSGSIILSIQGSGIDFTIFFYNPNIHPKKEYEIRKDENIRFAQKCGVPIVDAEYDTDNWYARAKGMEFEPERGSRCAMCFDMRMERTALYAHENGFDTIATSLGISRWKDLNQVNEAGKNAASKYEGLPIGTTIGAKTAVLPAIWKSAKARNSTNKSTVVALSLCGMLTNGA